MARTRKLTFEHISFKTQNFIHSKIYDINLIYFFVLQMNIGGASDRPVPTEIWQAVMQKMNNPTDDTPIDSSQLRVHGARSICTII